MLGKIQNDFYLNSLWHCAFFFANVLISEAPLLNVLHRYLRSLISLGLGIVNLFSLEIYFLNKQHNAEKVIRILLYAYTIVFFIGVIEYLVIKFHISSGYAFFSAIFKRNYVSSNRVQFFFTEPSFIGMHVFGILLPFYVVSKNRKLRNLIIVFSAFTIFTLTSVRFIFDTVIVGTILFSFHANFKKIYNIIAGIIFLLVIITAGYFAYSYNSRLQAIASRGIYGDGSSASRFFRIKATFIGYSKYAVNALFGYGLGNEILPIVQGYDEARKTYDSDYTREVDYLKHADLYDEHALVWCLYLKFMSEFGLMVSLFFLLFIIKHYIQLQDSSLKSLFWVIAYLYLQFEPYAFYSFWLYIVLSKMKISTSKFRQNN